MEYHHAKRESDKGALKKVIWHLQDVLKYIQKIEKEKAKRENE